MAPKEQNQHFTELRQIVGIYTYIVSAPKRFANFRWQTQNFCTKKTGKNSKASLGLTDYSDQFVLILA